MKLRRALIALMVLVLVATAAAGGWWWQNIYHTNTDANNVPVYTPGATPSESPTQAQTTPITAPTSSSPSSSASKAPAGPAGEGCSAQGQPIVPTSFGIDQMNVKSSVLSLGWDGGAAAAPPKNNATGVGWFNVGPKPGSKKGKVLLTIHTYRNGKALGNRLNDPRNGLNKGDVIRLSDGKGRTMCYRFDNAMKVYVKDYDPQSGILYDYTGPPKVVIVICWDYSWSKKDWESRILFYATPMFTT